METSACPKPMSLLRLPAEIRNQIYEESMPVDQIVPVTWPRRVNPPVMSQVCSQMRNECLSMYYHRNKFFLGSLPLFYPAAQTWIESLGCHSDDLNTIRIILVDNRSPKFGSVILEISFGQPRGACRLSIECIGGGSGDDEHVSDIYEMVTVLLSPIWLKHERQALSADDIGSTLKRLITLFGHGVS
ncbi:hypothetical protein M501DRAFT_991426 [Patellaria atrata CBS 101060]|uniref:2EXR domain-containing protein n=1 Tax=Patellaria atrata CBS 101060 TaxID=1346257 RepID=A0A9P4SCY6_9PEZI|nr:hypothetical protein M501DRAFT_991426 [Patellaria atrata CBS 101060]